MRARRSCQRQRQLNEREVNGDANASQRSSPLPFQRSSVGQSVHPAATRLSAGASASLAVASRSSSFFRVMSRSLMHSLRRQNLLRLLRLLFSTSSHVSAMTTPEQDGGDGGMTQRDACDRNPATKTNWISNTTQKFRNFLPSCKSTKQQEQLFERPSLPAIQLAVGTVSLAGSWTPRGRRPPAP